MPLCACCSHPDLAEIDKAIVAGVPIRQIAKRYGMSHPSVLRHKAKCISPSLISVATVEREEATVEREAAARLVAYDEVADLIPLLKLAMTNANANGQSGNFTALAGRLLTAIDTLGKLTKEIGPSSVTNSTVINIMADPRVQWALSVMYAELAAHPEIRERIAERLQLEAPA